MCLQGSGLAELRKEFSVSPGSKYKLFPRGWAHFTWISAGWGPAAAALRCVQGTRAPTQPGRAPSPAGAQLLL